MKKLPKISEAEWLVMKVLWEKSPRTASEVIEALENSTKWNPRTIKTLLSRLLNKKALDFEKDQADSRKYHYHPVVSEEECMKTESKLFLQRVYGGSLNIMVANYLEEQQLTKEEIKELKDFLSKMEKL